jgi:hypothetical protein
MSKYFDGVSNVFIAPRKARNSTGRVTHPEKKSPIPLVSGRIVGFPELSTGFPNVPGCR